MSRKKETIKRSVIRHMKELGVYKKEYGEMINIFVDMVHQYETLTEQFIDEGYELTEEHTNAAGATNTRKKPSVTAIEKLRVDIATYSNLLCLNPKHYDERNVSGNNSNLLTVLKGIE